MIDKKSLFDGVSIKKLLLCVKIKTITRCRTTTNVTFWDYGRKIRVGIREKIMKNFTTDNCI